MTFLPCILEESASNYLTGVYSGGYNVAKQFDLEDFEIPAIVAGASSFVEMEPGTNVFDGQLNFAVISQVDNQHPLQTHNDTTAQVYSLVTSTGFLPFLNTQQNGHVWGVKQISFDQSREDRAFISIITLDILAQSLAV